MQKIIDGVWINCTQDDLIVGDLYRVSVGNGGWQQQKFTTIVAIDKSDTEREWRDSELKRTDALVVLPDYPVNLLPYRLELRDYPLSIGFPNGARPTL